MTLILLRWDCACCELSHHHQLLTRLSSQCDSRDERSSIYSHRWPFPDFRVPSFEWAGVNPSLLVVSLLRFTRTQCRKLKYFLSARIGASSVATSFLPRTDWLKRIYSGMYILLLRNRSRWICENSADERICQVSFVLETRKWSLLSGWKARRIAPSHSLV